MGGIMKVFAKFFFGRVFGQFGQWAFVLISRIFHGKKLENRKNEITINLLSFSSLFAQIKLEAFLEDINNLLNAGEVPNIFPVDEKQEICEKMRQIDRQRDKTKQTDGSPLALYNMFVDRCKNQLHIVLTMSPIGDAFRNRLRKFPSLVNCCTIDWFQVIN